MEVNFILRVGTGEEVSNNRKKIATEKIGVRWPWLATKHPPCLIHSPHPQLTGEQIERMGVRSNPSFSHWEHKELREGASHGIDVSVHHPFLSALFFCCAVGLLGVTALQQHLHHLCPSDLGVRNGVFFLFPSLFPNYPPFSPPLASIFFSFWNTHSQRCQQVHWWEIHFSLWILI